MSFLISFKKSVSTSKYIFGYQLAERIFYFGFFLLMARTLTAEIFGEFTAVFTFANVIYVFFDFGLSIHLQKKIAEKKHNSSKIITEALWFFIIISILYLFLSLFIISKFYPKTDLFFIIIVVFSIILLACTSSLSAIFLAHQRYKDILGSIILTRPLIILLILFLIIIKLIQIEYFIEIWLIGIVFQIIILVWNLKNLNLDFKIVPTSFKNVFLFVTTIVPLGGAVIFNYLYDKIDVLLISKILDFSQVAYYTIPYGIYKSSSLAFNFLLISGLNRISSVSRRNSAVWLFFKLYSRLLLIITLPLFFLLYLFSDKILMFLYGNEYLQSTIILKILSVGLVGMSFNNLTGIILNGIGKYKINMYIAISAFMINITINYLLLPYYGIVASALITVIIEYYIFFGGLTNILKLIRN